MNRVYIPNERVMGEVISLLAHGAEVEYSVDGIMYHTFISGDDYIELEEFYE